ncbi:MAG: hypothetical protein ABSE69_09590 [Roseiarcus sp.]|jgi:hypothetical protein
MRQDFPANPPDSSGLCREIGLAAVAAELNLQVNTLESEVAEAVERGAAALFLAGYGPRLPHYPSRGRVGEQGSRRKVRQAVTKTRRSAHLRMKKVVVAQNDNSAAATL